MPTSQVSRYCKDRSQETNPENETRKIRLDMLSDHHGRLYPQRDKKRGDGDLDGKKLEVELRHCEK